MVTRCSGKTHAATRSGVRAPDSRLVDNRWVFEGPAPAWFRGAEHLRQGTPLALSDAFRVTQLLSAGDADDLEALLRVQVHRDPAARLSAPAFAVDLAAFRQNSRVPDETEVYWGPDGLLGVAEPRRGAEPPLPARGAAEPRARPAVRRERALALPAPGVAPEARAAGAPCSRSRRS